MPESHRKRNLLNHCHAQGHLSWSIGSGPNPESLGLSVFVKETLAEGCQCSYTRACPLGSDGSNTHPTRLLQVSDPPGSTCQVLNPRWTPERWQRVKARRAKLHMCLQQRPHMSICANSGCAHARVHMRCTGRGRRWAPQELTQGFLLSLCAVLFFPSPWPSCYLCNQEGENKKSLFTVEKKEPILHLYRIYMVEFHRGFHLKRILPPKYGCKALLWRILPSSFTSLFTGEVVFAQMKSKQFFFVELKHCKLQFTGSYRPQPAHTYLIRWR